MLRCCQLLWMLSLLVWFWSFGLWLWFNLVLLRSCLILSLRFLFRLRSWTSVFALRWRLKVWSNLILFSLVSYVYDSRYLLLRGFLLLVFRLLCSIAAYILYIVKFTNLVCICVVCLSALVILKSLSVPQRVYSVIGRGTTRVDASYHNYLWRLLIQEWISKHHS